MHYTCKLQRLEFKAFHGLYPEEQRFGGRFIVDLSVTVLKPDDALLNTLEEVVNYETLFAIIQRVMMEREDLIERVATKIRKEIKELNLPLTALEITVEKHNPAGLFGSGSATITLTD